MARKFFKYGQVGSIVMHQCIMPEQEKGKWVKALIVLVKEEKVAEITEEESVTL